MRWQHLGEAGYVEFANGLTASDVMLAGLPMAAL